MSEETNYTPQLKLMGPEDSDVKVDVEEPQHQTTKEFKEALTEESGDKELPAAFMRYMNGLMQLTTGSERGVQQLANLIGMKIIDTRMSALFHKVEDTEGAKQFGTVITTELRKVLDASIKYAQERNDTNFDVLQAALDRLEAPINEVRQVFPVGSYASSLWSPWFETARSVITVVQQYMYAFVDAGRLASISDEDLNRMLSSLLAGWDEWCKQVKRLGGLGGDERAMKIAGSAERYFAEIIKTARSSDEAVQLTVATLNKENTEPETKAVEPSETPVPEHQCSQQCPQTDGEHP